MTTSEEIATKAEKLFHSQDFSGAASEFSKLQGSDYQLLSELRLGMCELVLGNAQRGLDRIAKLTEPCMLADSDTPHPHQWAMVVLAIIANRLVEPAIEAIDKYPNLQSHHLNRAKWLLGVLVNWEPGKQITFSALERSTSDSLFPGEQDYTFDDFIKFVSHLLDGVGLSAELYKVVHAALAIKGSLSPGEPYILERIGSDYGGWVVPANELSAASVCYCPGVGEDISFDLGIIEKYGCTVHGIDPTPRAREHVAKVANNNTLYTFHPVGLWNEDTELSFYEPADPAHVSHSVDDLQSSSREGFKAKVKRLSSIMQDLGHTHIDLLKMDIEGAEYPVIEDLIRENISVRILCIEFHPYTKDPAAWFKSVTQLNNAGYRLLNIEHSNYSFVSTNISSQPTELA